MNVQGKRKLVKSYMLPSEFEQLETISKELNMSISSFIALCVAQSFECCKSRSHFKNLIQMRMENKNEK